MKPSVLFMTAGILVLTLSACPPLPTPPPGASFAPPVTAQVCDANGNLNDIPFLAPFMPKEPFDQSPQAASAQIDRDIQADLTDAFNTAPPFFRKQLCSLKGIFINPAGCSNYDPRTCSLSDDQIADNSWGFRQQPSGNRYIAISLGLWKNQPGDPCMSSREVCAPQFQTYRTKLVRALLERTPQPQPVARDPDPPSFTTYPNTSAMSVLAALAHEFGHILWWDIFVPRPGGLLDVGNTETFCGGDFYPSGSWQGMKVDLPGRRWIGYGEIRLQPSGSEVLKLRGFLRQGKYEEAAQSLSRIYRSRIWVSALAAFSPDEYFVETFELI